MNSELLNFFDSESALKRALIESVEAKITYFQNLLADFNTKMGRKFTTPQYEYWYQQEYPKPHSEKPEWYRLNFGTGELHFGPYEAKLRINSEGHLERYDESCGTEYLLDLHEPSNIHKIPLWELENANKLLDSFRIYVTTETAAMREQFESLQKRQKWEA